MASNEEKQVQAMADRFTEAIKAAAQEFKSMTSDSDPKKVKREFRKMINIATGLMLDNIDHWWEQL